MLKIQKNAEDKNARVLDAAEKLTEKSTAKTVVNGSRNGERKIQKKTANSNVPTATGTQKNAGSTIVAGVKRIRLAKKKSIEFGFGVRQIQRKNEPKVTSVAQSN